MPVYEYECQACKYYTEVMQKITDTPLSKCPSCGKRRLKRLVSAPVFRLKGAGWYETDFKSDKEAKRNLLAAEKEEAKAEGKPEAKEAPEAGKEPPAGREAAGGEEAAGKEAAPQKEKQGAGKPAADKEAGGSEPATGGKAIRESAPGSGSRGESLKTAPRRPAVSESRGAAEKGSRARRRTVASRLVASRAPSGRAGTRGARKGRRGRR